MASVNPFTTPVYELPTGPNSFDTVGTFDQTLAPGVPNPSKISTSGTGKSSGNGSPNSSGGGGPAPRRYQNFEIKQKLLRPALTSHFQCWFNPPDAIRSSPAGQYYLDGGELISLLCSDASLPGSSILTTEMNDDYTGVTERLGYRRSYDNQIDFTFFVDHGRQNGSYNVISFFEEWIRYVAGDTSTAPDGNFFSRAKFADGPSGYRTEIYVQKFERDFQSNYFEYTFVRAYPINIASIPISYESSQLLRCQVSFTYNRYIITRKGNVSPQIPGQQPSKGVPNVGDTSSYLDPKGNNFPQIDFAKAANLNLGF
jgi:hypothetical protein